MLYAVYSGVYEEDDIAEVRTATGVGPFPSSLRDNISSSSPPQPTSPP